MRSATILLLAAIACAIIAILFAGCSPCRGISYSPLAEPNIKCRAMRQNTNVTFHLSGCDNGETYIVSEYIQHGSCP